MKSTVESRQLRRTEENAREVETILENIISELVDDPESCDVRFTRAGSLLLIEVVPEGSRPASQLIGKQGRTIAALRTLATGICAKYGWRAQLEIVA